jgi:hypothetical protein
VHSDVALLIGFMAKMIEPIRRLDAAAPFTSPPHLPLDLANPPPH